MKRTILKYFPMVLLCSAAITMNSTGQTINWGSTASATTNHNFLSDGSTPMPVGFQAEIGWFNSSFDATDPTTWATAWTAIDAGTLQPNTGFAGFNYDAAVNGPFGAIPSGTSAYLWAFENKLDAGESSSEMLLLTDIDWRIDTLGSLDVVTWTTGSAPNLNVVWGAVDQTPTLAGGVGVGAFGVPDSQLADNAFHLQTALAVNPIPEPGSIALVLLGLSSVVFCRRRSD